MTALTALAHVLQTLLGDLVALGAAAALPLLLALPLRGWVRRDPAGVQAPRSATGLAGADLRTPLPGSASPRTTPAPSGMITVS
ncbi:MAG: hypothetical protein ACTHOD_18015 [Motilibacteraceae bacterium]